LIGKEVAAWLEYADTDWAIRYYVNDENKLSYSDLCVILCGSKNTPSENRNLV
jgi:hypothetical protein